MSEKKNNRDFKHTLSLIGRGLKHLLLHNGWLKMIAILISVLLWAGLISQDDSITREKTFQNVKVTVNGQEALKGNGLIVTSDLDNIYVDFTAAVPQKQYEKAEASNYNVRLDLSRINETGLRNVQILKNNSSQFGNVISVKPESVTLEVERYIPRDIPVSAEFSDIEPDGWKYVQGECDPSKVHVSGPQRIVDEIFRAKCYVTADDVDWASGPSNSTPVSFDFYKKNGEIIDKQFLSITSSNVPIDTIMVSYRVQAKKTFSTIDCANLTGKVAKGYEITGVTYSPETITILDSSEVLDNLEKLALEDTEIKVNGLKATKSFPLKVIKPSDESELTNDTITVTIEVAEAEEP